ncbi:MAG: flagellar protein FlaG [Methylococcales bacterium]|jgi:flagellar protein FlaG|nr:flagellar protein FlaG [Methylococcales bacterium]MBT7443350.1 flagellar protein FlaG [Methylococcales bacterium]
MSTVNNSTNVTVNQVVKPQQQNNKSDPPAVNALYNKVEAESVAVDALEEKSSGAIVREEEKAQEKPLDPKALNEVVSDLNDFVQNVQREISFSVDEPSGGVVVKVRNAGSEEVIRQIPSEEVLAIKERLKRDDDDPTGLVLNARV